MTDDRNPMPRFRSTRGAIDITAVCLIILTLVALAWFFGVHATTAH